MHEACGSDELRPILMCVHFKDGFAYSSDANVIVKQSLEYHTIINPEFLEGKSVHKDNYKAIMQFEKAECNEEGISCSDSDGRTAFFEYFHRVCGEIPNFDSILKPIGQKSVEFIGINPECLHRISRAMHVPSGSLRLQFQGVDRGVLIDSPEIPNQWGLLAPTIINDTLFS